MQVVASRAWMRGMITAVLSTIRRASLAAGVTKACHDRNAFNRVAGQFIVPAAAIASMGSNAKVENVTPTLRLADIPRPPDGSLRVLSACVDDDIELPRVAAIVMSDPALAADLLQVVNSAFFGLGSSVTSIARAVAVLGLNALRNRVLCLTVRAVTSQLELPNVGRSAFVEDSLRHAVAAHALAADTEVDADDAFTAGLLQDFGMLVLAFLHPEVTRAQWDSLRGAPPDARHTLERALFGDTHEAVLGELAGTWMLPPALVTAIASHHDSAPESALARVLAAADWVTAVYANPGDEHAMPSALARLKALLGLDQEAAFARIAALPAVVENAAAALGMRVPAQSELDVLSTRVNARLADDNLSFQEMNWQLAQALRERDELAERLRCELEIAREVQCSLLPSHALVRAPIWARNVAAQELSGDFYDYFNADDGRLVFNLGDVSGKGLTAALLMAKTCSLFRCLGRRGGDLSEIMAVINDELAETSIRGMFVTMIAGVYDLQTGQVQIVSAGHPPPLLWREGESLAMVAVPDTPPLGIIAGITFPARTLSLGHSSLYLYSDGISEALDANGEAFGINGLARLIACASRLAPPARIDSIVAAVTSAGDPRRDDITLAVLDPSAAC